MGERIAGTTVLRLIFLVAGATLGLVAASLGLVPVWTVAPFAAGGLLAWAVAEYLADRPIKAAGEEVKQP